MKKFLKSKKFTIPLVLILFIFSSVLGINKYNSFHEYKNLIKDGENYASKGDYDKAISCFKKSLNYKQDASIKNKLAKIENLKIYKENSLKNSNDNLSKSSNASLIKGDTNKKDVKPIDKSIKLNNNKNKNFNSNIKSKNKTIKKIDQKTAAKIALSVRPSSTYIRYIEIKKVPFINKKGNPKYTKFPKEISNKHVYVFEILNKKEHVTLGMYYVDFYGHVYKDTYPSNLKCIKVK